MDPLQLLAYRSSEAAKHELHAALPDAPVRRHEERGLRLGTTRLAVAGLLRRAADRLEPHRTPVRTHGDQSS